MSRIYWDSMLFVYWFEDHPQHANRVQKIFTRMRQRQDTLCTSVLTVGEVLTGPYKKNALESVNRVRDFFHSPQIEILPFTTETADSYARIRAQHRLAPADAIHISIAASAGIDLFLTNDDRLLKITVPGIDFIARMDVSLF